MVLSLAAYTQSTVWKKVDDGYFYRELSGMETCHIILDNEEEIITFALSRAGVSLFVVRTNDEAGRYAQANENHETRPGGVYEYATFLRHCGLPPSHFLRIPWGTRV